MAREHNLTHALTKFEEEYATECLRMGPLGIIVLDLEIIIRCLVVVFKGGAKV
jgi:hypothetical protein